MTEKGAAKFWYISVFYIGVLALLISGCGAGNVVNPSSLAVSDFLHTARVDQAYSDWFTATGGTPPYKFSGYGFPAGMTLDASTGELKGTPLATNAGVTLTVTVQDSSSPAQSATVKALLIIKPLGVSITTETLDPGYYNLYYTGQIQIANGVSPYIWQIGPNPGSLPPGLHLDRTTGFITGVPSAKGTYTFTVTVTDSDSPATSHSKDYTLVIQ